jgi:Tfp pilus assembly protein FimV
MAAVTIFPGYEAPAVPAIRSLVPRGATPRGARVSPRTYRRRRVVIATLALGLVVVATQAGAALGGVPLAPPERRPTVSHVTRVAGGRAAVVQPGDSLWSLATRLAPDEDPRTVVDALSASRAGAPLVPGEVIRLPE